MSAGKFHINADGEPGICEADERNCPFGETGHWDTAEDALAGNFGGSLPEGARKNHYEREGHRLALGDAQEKLEKLEDTVRTFVQPFASTVGLVNAIEENGGDEMGGAALFAVFSVPFDIASYPFRLAYAGARALSVPGGREKVEERLRLSQEFEKRVAPPAPTAVQLEREARWKEQIDWEGLLKSEPITDKALSDFLAWDESRESNRRKEMSIP